MMRLKGLALFWASKERENSENNHGINLVVSNRNGSIKLRRDFVIRMDEFYYCGFNGFGQVPNQPENQLTTLVCQNKVTSTSPSTQQNNQSPSRIQDVVS